MADAEAAVLDPAAAPEAAPDAQPTSLVVTRWLSDAARTRLNATGKLELVDDIDQAAAAALVVVSTRIPVGESPAFLEELRTTTASPIVAVVHPGGEETAVELLSAGASAIVAEGNEQHVVALLGSDNDGKGLLERYEQSVDRRSSGTGTGSGDLDPVTRLRGAGGLASRLAAAQGTAVPRLGFARIVGLERATRRLSEEARDFLRRRVARQMEELCHHFRAELYATAPGEFAIVADDLGVADFERLAHEMTELIAGYSPDRNAPLALAVGHAGPEATSYVETLRDLAMRGMELATDQPDQGVVGAERLAMSLAASTELEATMRAAAVVEERDPYPGSHGERVARHAVVLAETLDLTATSQLVVRLAARLHDVGKLTLSDEAIAGTEDSLTGDELRAYQEHPERGAEMLRASAGTEVAEAVAAHHERWDGSGFPKGLSGDEIPLAARIISVADALDRWSVNGTVPDRPTASAVQKVTEGSETLFDPTVVTACVKAFGSS